MHVTYVKLQRQSGVRYKAIIREGDRVVSTKTFTRKTDATIWAKTLLRDEQRLEALGNPQARISPAELADLFLGAKRPIMANRIADRGEAEWHSAQGSN